MANQNRLDQLFAERLRQAEDRRRQSRPVRDLNVQTVLGLDPYEIAANRGQQRDPQDMSEMERLIHQGDYETIRAKYGREVLNTIRARMGQGTEDFLRDTRTTRTGLETGIDLATAAPQGFASMGFGLGSLGAGLFSPELGARIAQAGQSVDDAISGVQSDRLTASERMHRARMAVRERANAAQQQREKDEGSSSFMAGLRRIGRDIRDSVGSNLQDPTLIAQRTTDAAVSMAVSAGVAGVARAGLSAATRGAASRAATKEARDRLARRVSTGSWMGAVGALEGGGAFQESALNVMDRTPQELMETSDDYRAKVTELQLRGRTQAQAFAEAQEWLAGRTGLRAAGPQTVAGAAISRVAMGGQNPTRLRPLKGTQRAAKEGTQPPRFATLRAGARDTGEEIIEEGSQGFTGTLSQNLALQAKVDPEQDLLEGVGSAVGEGALYAGPGVGVMKGVGAARWGLSARENLARRGNEIIKREQERSTVSPQAIQRTTQKLQEAGEKSTQVMHRAIDASEASEEDKTAAKDQINRLIDATTKPPEKTSVQDQLSSEMLEKYGEPDNRFAALESAAELVLEAEEGSQEKAQAALHFLELLGPLSEHLSDPKLVDALIADKDAGRLRGVFAVLIDNAVNSEKTKQAFAQAKKILQEGQASNPVVQAQVDPAHGNLDEVQQILEEANQGRINLTPSELAALESHRFLLEARAEVASDLEGSDAAVERVTERQIDKRLLTRREMVSGEVVDGEGVGEMPSALEHVQRFTQAIQAGNPELAQGFLEDFALFVEHMQNKVEALNAHLKDPSQPYVPYRQLVMKDGQRQWKDSSTNAKREHKGAFVNQKSEESIIHAQTVHGEARLLHGLLSRLAEAHPELGVKVPQAHTLDPILLGNPKEVVQRLASRNQGARESTEQSSEQTKVPLEKAPLQQEAKAPVGKSKQVEAPKQEAKPTSPVEKLAQKKAPAEKTKPAPEEKKVASLVRAERVPEAPKGLVQIFNEMSDQERLDRHYVDTNSGLPNARAFEDFQAEEGTLVVQISFEGSKYINDSATEGEVRGHDKGNQVYREVGRAIGRSLQGDQFAAKVGGDFGIKNITSQKEADNLLRRVRRHAKVHGLQITMGVGKTYAEAAAAHIAAKERAEKRGRRAKRGDRPLGLQGDVNELTFGNGTKAETKLPPVLIERHQQMMQDPEAVFRRIYVEEGSGLLTGEGFYALPRKKFQLKLDLNWLKQLNEESHESGDRALLEFGKQIVAIGGRALDFAHVSGDEYVAQSDHQASLEDFAKQLANHAGKVQIPIFNQTTGERLTLNGLTFGYGIGRNDAQAESALIAHKQQQEVQRLRGVFAEEAFAERLDGRDQRDGKEGGQDRDRDAELAPTSIEEVAPGNAVAKAYPEVTKRPSNLLALVYKLKQKNGESTTRTQGLGGGVVEFVRGALKDQETLNQTTGQKISRAFGKEARDFFQGLLQTKGKARHTLGGIMDTLERNLDAYLDRRYKKDEPYTIRDIFLHGPKAGMHMEHLRDARVLNLVEVGEDGEVRYNSELLQLSALAGLQWWLTMSQRQSEIYEEDAQAITKLADPPRELINMLNQGMGGEEAVRSLGSMLLRFWGFTGERSADLAVVEGIATAMAGEVLRALTEHKMLSPVTVPYGQFHDPPNKQVTIRHKPTVLEKGKHPVYSRALAIEEVVVKEPEQISYYGPEAEIPVARTQGRNSRVFLTERQQQTLEARQRQTHTLNAPMANVIAGMGREGVLAAFGTEVKDESLFNKNHLDSVEGQNLGLIGALEQFSIVFQEMEAVAEAQGIPVEEVQKRYAYVVTNVNRYMMVGRYNPQSSQLMRQLLLPTRSTLDLSQPGEHLDAFYMAVGQALDFGAKLNKHSPQQVVEMTLAKLEDLEPARKILSEWYADRSKPFPAKKFRAALEAQGVESTPLALHALLEVNRMESADVDLTQFQTSLYLEIDGQNNGVFNSLGLLDPGGFTANKIDNYKRGGLSLGSAPRTADTLFAEVGSDLYEATTIKGREYVSQRLKEVGEAHPEAVARAEMLLNLMDLLGMDVEVQGKGGEFSLVISRGAAKTPMMVRTYGSGANGIANQIAKDLLDLVYGRISEMLQAQARGEPQWDKIGQVLQGLDSLVRSNVGMRDGAFYFAEMQGMTSIINRLRTKNGPQQFTFTPQEQRNLRSHIRTYFVDPMIQAITEVQGETIEQSSTMLREVSQIQSVILRSLFQNAIEDKIEEKKKSGEGGFLSEAELFEIEKNLRNVTPRLTMDGQPFLLTGTKILELARGRKEPSALEISRALDGTFKNHASVYAPDDPQVAAIPRVVQGMGDARMMREVYADGGGQNSLDTYDGMSLPLDSLEKEGQNANRASLHAFTGNVFAGLRRSMERAFADPKVVAELRTNNALVREVISTLRLATPEQANKMKIDIARDLLQHHINGLMDRLDVAENRMAAKNRVLARVALSMDQMAGAYAPFVREGEIDFVEGTSSEEIAHQLNLELARELEKADIRPREPIDIGGRNISQGKEKIDGAKITTLFHAKPKPPSGVTVLTETDVPTLLAGMDLSPSRRALVEDLLKANDLKGWRVVVGTPAQVLKHQWSEGLALDQTEEPTAHGMAIPSAKIIYLMTDSAETVVHELIHAATFGAVWLHYAGQGTARTAKAVQRLEQLMDRFLHEAPEDDAARNVWSSAVLNILDLKLRGKKAEALNEFMAWILANQDLSDWYEGVDLQGNRLKRIGKAALRVLKNFLFGSKKDSTNFLSELRFQTKILAEEAPSAGTLLRENALFHTTMNPRLAGLRREFTRKVADKFSEFGAGKGDSSTYLPAVHLSRQAQHLFEMDPEEAHTFEMIVAAAATEQGLDPQGMREAHKVFVQVLRELDATDFIPEGIEEGTAAYEDARQLHNAKVDFLLGREGTLEDGHKRSSLLPVFLALSLTNDEFRAALSRLDLPQGTKSDAGGFDRIVENLGHAAFDRISKRLGGLQKPGNVLEAMDQLGAFILDSALEERESLQVVNRGLNSLDAFIARGLNALGKRALDKAEAGEGNKLGEAVLQSIAALTSDEGFDSASEKVLAFTERSNLRLSIRELVADMVGRTESIGRVYDRAKQVKSTVSKARQGFIKVLPRTIKGKFSQRLSSEQWDGLHRTMARSDLASLAQGRTSQEVLRLVADPQAIKAEAKRLVEELKQAYTPAEWKILDQKISQLAHYMRTGISGPGLLGNAYALARLMGQNIKNPTAPTEAMEQAIDQLVTLRYLQETDLGDFASLVQSEPEGMEFALNFLRGLRLSEVAKAQTDMARVNHIKGRVPETRQGQGQLIVAKEDRRGELRAMGFEQVGAYEGSNIETGSGKWSYFYAPKGVRVQYTQGIVQNVDQSAYGVQQDTGFLLGESAGIITDPVKVKFLARRMHLENVQGENLRPIFDAQGKVVAFERMLHPDQLQRLQEPQDLAITMGRWAGRQTEEIFAQEANRALVEDLARSYREDIEKDPKNQELYVDLFNTNLDSVVAEAVRLIPPELHEVIEEHFPDGTFMVRKSMLNTVLGYRNPTVGDFWTGNSRWSRETQKEVRNVLVGLLGIDAYKMLTIGERNIQALMYLAKTNIVVRSVLIPAVNLVSTYLQLLTRGSGIAGAAREMVKKGVEIESYQQLYQEQVRLEAEITASMDLPQRKVRLEAELKANRDMQRRLSIWPLIEAGELSTISDLGLQEEVRELKPGNLVEHLTQQVNKLSPRARELARQGMIGRDTALFRALMKSVQYGDFTGKAVLYDHLTKKEGLSKEAALARITEEFVNYDIPPGRTRGYVESIGLLWFYNYKLRTVKVGLSQARNNPLRTLLVTLMPTPYGIGTPFTENVFAKFGEGTLGYSIGPAMLMQGAGLHPLYSAWSE